MRCFDAPMPCSIRSFGYFDERSFVCVGMNHWPSARAPRDKTQLLWVDGAENRRTPDDAEQADHDEPGEHHRREELANERGAFVLDQSCEQSARERRKVEMCFAHLKRHLGFRPLRLRGMTGASDKFLLVAVMQNLKKRVRFSRGTRA
jgi:Transposase DDE domain